MFAKPIRRLCLALLFLSDRLDGRTTQILDGNTIHGTIDIKPMSNVIVRECTFIPV